MTGRELIDLIHKLNAEDMEVFVGSEGYATNLCYCKKVNNKVFGEDDCVEKLLLSDDCGGYEDVTMYR